MGYTHYTQKAFDVADLIRQELGGDNKDEALDVIVSKVSGQVPDISVDLVRDGLLKLADNVIVNPATRHDPEAAIKAMDKNALANELAAVVLGKKWAAQTGNDSPAWEIKGR